MRKIVRAPSLSFSVAAAITAAMLGVLPVHAQEMSKDAKIERILELTNSQATFNQLIDQMTTMMSKQLKTQMPNATPEQVAQAQGLQSKVMELLRTRISFEKMRPELLKIYGTTYSDEEIDGMLAFFQSPAGQGYLKKVPALTQQIMAITQAQLGDLMPDIQRLSREATQGKP
jgi:hypothetical protein